MPARTCADLASLTSRRGRDEGSRHGRVQTVLGLVGPADLGEVMMHEHIGRPIGGHKRAVPALFSQPDDKVDLRYAYEPVTLENLWWVRYNFRHSLDNLTPAPWHVWDAEVHRYAAVGGGSLCEVSAANTVDLDALALISESTGVHIIAGAGFYTDGSYPDSIDVARMSLEALAQVMCDAILIGDADGRKCGLLGELGCSWPLTVNEHKVLVAACLAQRETGVSISVHPGRNDAAPAEIAQILTGNGADLTRVIMGHMDRCGYSLTARRQLLDAGLVIEYDVFGMEGHYPADVALADGVLPDMPNDAGRMKQIAQLAELGYEDQIVVGHDVHMKFQMAAYGGYGYGHYLRNVRPLMPMWGVRDQVVRKLTQDNPQRLLTIQ